MKETKKTDVSIPMVIFLIFVVLRLTGNIDWSWWWVFSPIWGTFAIRMIVTVILTIVKTLRGIVE